MVAATLDHDRPEGSRWKKVMRNLEWAEEKPSGEMEGTVGDLPNFASD